MEIDRVEPARPAYLWKDLSDERRLEAARAFWADADSAEFQVEAIGALARQMNFRAKSVLSLPLERKARSLASIRSLSDTVALRALVAYHLEHQRPMMAAFLDRLSVAHENGVINSTDELKPPAAESLQAAADVISAAHPAEDVKLYLTTLLTQDPETWGGLADVRLRASAPAAQGSVG
jgi:hypothetical protein